MARQRKNLVPTKIRLDAMLMFFKMLLLDRIFETNKPSSVCLLCLV